MNKVIPNLFLIIVPFYPFWAWLCHFFFNKPFDFFVGILLFPVAFYLILTVSKKLPAYLRFFIIFTIYHICSVFVNDTFPKNTNKLFFFLTDPNVLACLFFIIIENEVFDRTFIKKMNKCILLIVIISLAFSLIQIKLPTFFISQKIDSDLFYVENRNFSIYSWVNMNTGGITFPILTSILISVYERNKFILPLVILSGTVVSFLTRARYVMLSTLLVFSQLFFNKKKSITKRVSLILILAAGIFFIGMAASNFGYDIEEVINTRILEKGNDLSSARARITSYEVFLFKFPEHPWFGVGPETKKDVIDLLNGEAPAIHVGYLCYLYFYGAIGAFILFLAIFFLLRDAWMVGKKYNFWGSFYGIVSFCLANLVLVYFNFNEMGIVISLIYLRYYRSRSSLRLKNPRLRVNDKALIMDKIRLQGNVRLS